MRLTRLVLPTLIVLVLLLVAAPVAAANTYTVYTCKTPSGARAPVDSLSAQSNGYGAVTANQCDTGGSLVASLPGNVAQVHAGKAAWRFLAPADTEIKMFDLWHWAANTQHPSDGTHEPGAYVGWPSGDPSDAKLYCLAVGCVSSGVPTDAIDSRNHWWSGYLTGVREVFFAAGCVGSDRQPCAVRGGGRPMSELRMQGIRWTLVDDHLPVVSGVAGDLTGSGAHNGVEAISFDATDKGSGVFRALIELKPSEQDQYTPALVQTVDGNDGRCARLEEVDFFNYEWGHAVPCALSTSAEIDWDTASLPDGRYRLRIRVEDAAGNSTTIVPSRDFEIDNVPPPAATVPPRILGIAQKDSNILGDKGEWNGSAMTFTREWLRCADAIALASCQPIQGATADNYRIVTEDLGRYLRFRVTATSSDGTGTAVSDASPRVTNTAGVVPQCADGIDNDKDGKIDTDDPACPSRENIDEAAETIPSGPFTPMPSATTTPTATSSPSGGGNNQGGSDQPIDRGEPNGSNASDRARFVISGGGQAKLPFGRGATKAIALRDDNGRPIAKATVLVFQRMSVPGGRWIPAHSPITTDADGRIRYAIEPRFSRKLRFAYRSHEGDASFAATRELTVAVRSRTSMTTSRSYLRNGDAVIFKGRLASRPVPRNGIVIDLQAQVGRRWQTFQTLRTARDGRWKARYRFRSTTGVQTYTFRARVRGDSGYPYSPSISRRVKVRVRG